MIVNLVRLARPKQWIKNFFVFAPLLFSRNIFHLEQLIPAVEAFFIFCLTSSAVYVINDIFDAESDRVHPKKKYRPIASGEISVRTAVIFVVILAAAVILTTYHMRVIFSFFILLYFITNLLYSMKVKSIVLLDVFFISFGFVLRVLGGAAAIDVVVSSWMALTTIFISLFLAISKRRGELSQIVNNENIEKQRKVLKDYSVDFADQLNTIAAAGTIISYALYTLSERTVTMFNTDKLIFTTPFVIYGIFRYMFLMHKKNMGESPTSIVTKDIPLVINVFLWLGVCLLLVYKTHMPFLSGFFRFLSQ